MALTDNIISYWKFDESSGNATDSAGSNTLTNNGAVYATGKINNGADLELDDADYFSITDASQSGLDISGSFTMNLWIKLESITSQDRISLMQKLAKDANTNRQYLFYIDAIAGTIAIFLSSDGSSWDIASAVGVSKTFSTATWYMVSVTRNGTTGDLKFYVDGSQQGATQSGGTSAIRNDTEPFIIGGGSVTTGRFLDGLVDEAGIWSRELSSTEISTLYNSGNGLQYPFVTDLSISINDQINITESVTMLITSFINVSDQVNITEAVIMLITSNINISDQINITENVSINVFFEGFSVSVSDQINITEAVIIENPNLGGINISDQVNITESVTVQRDGPPDRSINVSDEITITESVTVTLISNINVSDQVNITESVTMFTPDRLSGVSWMRSNEDTWPLGMDDETII